MIFVYARVSKAEEQDTRLQEATCAAGAAQIFAEHASDRRKDPPALHRRQRFPVTSQVL
jgi:hypothetical protein